MDDEDDDAHLPTYHHQHHQMHHLYSEELHRVAAEDHRGQQEGAEEEGREDEEEEDDDEEDDEEEDEEEEDDGIDDDEDEDDGGDQEQHNYEQDFELEQRDKRGTQNLLHNGNEVASPAPGLITLLASHQQQQQQPAVRTEVPQQVDSKPNVRDDWTEPATHALLEAWGERYVQLNKGNLKQEDWEEVALIVSAMSKIHKTDVQCKNRLDTLKKKYKVEKHKQSAIGSSDSKWPFYKQLDKLLSATVKRAGIPGAVDAGQAVKSCAFDSRRGEHLNRLRKFEAGDRKAALNNTCISSKSKDSPDVTFSSPPHVPGTDGTQSSSRKRKCMDTPFKTLAKAITKFGEIYEKMEQSKQQQLMDLEKIRMEFTRDLELQRMQLFMQTQVELAKMKHGDNDVDTTVSNLSG